MIAPAVFECGKYGCEAVFETPQFRFHCRRCDTHTVMAESLVCPCGLNWAESLLYVAPKPKPEPLAVIVAPKPVVVNPLCSKSHLAGAHGHCTRCGRWMRFEGYSCGECRPSHHPGSSTWIPTSKTRERVA